MSLAAAAAPNPGHLKFELTAKGIRLDDAARAQADTICTLAPQGDLERGLDLVLSEDVWVTAPVDEGGSIASPFVLSGEGNHFLLARDGTPMDVRLVPQPQFYAQTTSTRPADVAASATVYGSFIAINPAAACGYSLRGVPCRFCRIGTPVAPRTPSR